MRTFLALAIPLTVLAAPTPAQAAQLVCHKTGERVGGLKKTCYYDCGAFQGGRQDMSTTIARAGRCAGG